MLNCVFFVINILLMKKLFFILCLLSFVGLTGFKKHLPKNDNHHTISKESIVYITKKGKRYHKVSCFNLNKERIEIDKAKAKEMGYSACPVCKP